jgi:hypothetical protein
VEMTLASLHRTLSVVEVEMERPSDGVPSPEDHTSDHHSCLEKREFLLTRSSQRAIPILEIVWE